MILLFVILDWFQLGSLLPITTPAPPTTPSSPVRPPFEASNLINNIPQPVDGPNVSIISDYRFKLSSKYKLILFNAAKWYPKMVRTHLK